MHASRKPAHDAVRSRLRQQDARELANGYSRSFRRLELLGITLFVLSLCLLAYKLSLHVEESPWLVLSAVLSAYLAADLVSGLVHWTFDTWGTTRTPLFGAALIRPFREHHVDAKAITRHDFVETNGANCLFTLPVATAALLIPLGPGDWQWARLFGSTFLGGLVLWLMATNQFHKWAHADQVPAAIRWLQRLHLILPPAHHEVHHTAPFSSYYCITVGWMNGPLHRLGVFRGLERLVTATLGRVPREDDIGLEAALATAPAPSEPPEPERAPSLR